MAQELNLPDGLSPAEVKRRVQEYSVQHGLEDLWWDLQARSIPGCRWILSAPSCREPKLHFPRPRD